MNGDLGLDQKFCAGQTVAPPAQKGMADKESLVFLALRRV